MSVSMTPPANAPDFLAAVGWGDARIEPLAGDASFRRYFRVRAPGRDAVLMDAPPPHEDPRPFIAIANYLIERGFHAPRIYASDLANGFVLIEDFGDVRMRETIDADPGRESAIYASAIDLLVRLHQHPAAALRPYDRTEYQREAALFTQWYCPVVDLAVDEAGYVAAWDAALRPVLASNAQAVTTLRDYHAENIMLIGDGARLGLLDFQDALCGHPAYDLVSLLQDARRDVSRGCEADMLARYRAATGADAAFDDAYWVLGAQRNAKILGIFTRLWKRDGKPHYLTLQPRVWGNLEHCLAQPALSAVRQWFDHNVPPAKRAAFWAQVLP